MAKGSVIVNGVKFEDNAASIMADDTLKTPAFLDDGMTVKVKGVVNSDRLTGTAEKIKVSNEVRGAITSKGVDSLLVLGQTVFVDGATLFKNVSGFDALQPGDVVEVHGQRDAAGDIRAVRVELVGAGLVDEVKGPVSEKDLVPSTFKIGGLLISYDANTVIVPAGASFANGDVVEVHLGAGNVATRIEVEDEFEPAEGQEFEVEGFISGFGGHPGTFMVGAQQVQTLESTRFRSGISDDLADNMKVEAEGHLVGDILVADQIKFKATVRIESNVESESGAAKPTSFSLLGKTVMIATTTELNNVSLPIASGAGLKIRGFMNLDGSITATKIQSANAVDPDRHILRGPVSSFDAAARTMVIAGLAVNAAGVSANEVKDSNENIISMDQFFASLTPDRTVVKTRGSFAAGTITANQIELE
jgi:ribosomal protein S28E/S33